MKVEVLEVDIQTRQVLEGPYLVEIEFDKLDNEACMDAMEETWGSSCCGEFRLDVPTGIWFVNASDTEQVQIKQVH